LEPGCALEDNNAQAPPEILRILWNQQVHYRVQTSSPLVEILSEMKPVYTNPFYLLMIHLNVILPQPLGLNSGLFPSDFLNKTLLPMRVACSANPIVLDFKSVITFCEVYQL
jgi:hypothetical protein